mmetsp:Transcript_104670/g.207928  ORF Transcript_104670/g.207928 Transcript_104670/m.207928 type:complete len:242 (-) Transcript_104670:82-807(-)
MASSTLLASYLVYPICLIHLLVCINLMGWWPTLLVGERKSPFLLWPNAAVFCICVLSSFLCSPQCQVDIMTAALSVSILVDLAGSATSAMHSGVHGPCKMLHGGPPCAASGAGALGGFVILTCLKALGLCALTLARRNSWPFGLHDKAGALLYLKRPMRKATDGEANTVNLFPVLLAPRPSHSDVETPVPSPLSFRAPPPPSMPLHEPPLQSTLSYGALEEECAKANPVSALLVPFEKLGP